MANELTTNKRKGLLATLLIHAILVLLMLQWLLKTDKALAEDEGGLMVTFNTEQSGGPDETTEFSESSEAQVNEDQPQVEETVTESQPVTQPVTQPATVTTDAEDAPEVTTQKEAKPVKQEPQLDPSLKERLGNFGSRNRTSTSDRDRRSGTGPGKEGTGSRDATNTGPGGSGLGDKGIGDWSGNFGGFHITGGKTILADFEVEGTVILDICVDKTGKLEIRGRAPGTTTYNEQLFKLAKEAALSYKFTPKSGATTAGCGTFKVVFKKTL